MKKIAILLLTFFYVVSNVSAQKVDKFSETPAEYFKQLEEIMKASKRKDMEDAYNSFEKLYKQRFFSDQEIAQIIKTSNLMMTQKLTANPFFLLYLTDLAIVKKEPADESKFVKWHGIVDQMLNDIDKRKLTPIEDFLQFSKFLFERNSFRYGDGGLNWYARAPNYEMIYENKEPVIAYDKLNLVCERKKDSISINETAGKYYPVQGIFKGKGGIVTWERLGLKDVNATLTDYTIDIRKSIYTVPKVTLHYPTLFPDKDIEGSFEDKISAETKTNEGTYPRFKSFDNVLKISNLGQGLEYLGGFRLEGTTVYGYGNKTQRAKINIVESGRQIFKAYSELFIIRKGERVVGEQVETSLYFGKDSIYHPSVNFRYEIKNKTLQLTRGDRGSDRNPFYDSYHKTNISSDKINWYLQNDSIVIGERSVASAANKTAEFESLKFYEEGDYRRLQSIGSTNPIAVLKLLAEEQKKMTIEADIVAKRLNPKFDVSSIQGLIIDLSSKGFISYDADNQLITIKDKVLHYANASLKKVDYDNLKLISDSDEKSNAVFNLRDKKLVLDGVKSIEFSPKQKVALKPDGDRIYMKENRNMDYRGKVFAGFSNFFGKSFHFDYDKYQMDLDSVRYFDLYIPNGEKDNLGNPIAKGMNSRIEYLNGVLLIDAPNNKSGKENIEMFPSFQSKDNSFVFYDKKITLDSCYTRDSFYFKLDKFSFNHLDNFVKDDVVFKGTMVSSKIFPNFNEILTIQEDNSLGFKTNTPVPNGFPAYSGKGNFKGQILLSNKGLLGKGNISYIGSQINSEDIVFKPKQMLASAKKFELAEDRTSAVKVPQVLGFDVNVNWRPYRDSMYVTTKEKPFEMFKAKNHTLKGTIILTPKGVRGRGLFDWDKGSMTSKLFSFGANSTYADTMDMQIKAVGANALAFDTRNVSGVADFDEQVGKFKSNSDNISTSMPYNQYQTSMNEFNWDMKAETVTFKADEKKLATFLSTDKEQDSLSFKGKTAFYNLKTYELKIGGVPEFQTADAFVYTQDGNVEIKAGGIMSTLNNAKILCDITNKYHVINRATVNVKGKKLYTAQGYYEYNIGNRKQEILFNDIVGERIGKGARSDKRTETRATGDILEKDTFFMDHKTEFRGKIRLAASSKNLTFEGYARLVAPKLPIREWFTINCAADKNDLAIPFNEPKNDNGTGNIEPLRTGIFLSKESAQMYPSIMSVLFFRKDRPFFETKGILKYNKNSDQFYFGDSLRVSNPTVKTGNILTYHNKNGKVNAEGKFNIGSELRAGVSITAAGRSETAVQLSPNDTIPLMKLDYKVYADLMVGVDCYVPEKLLQIMNADFKSYGLDAQDVDYNLDLPFYEKSLTTFIPDETEWAKVVNNMKEKTLDIPKKYNKFPILFNYLPMRWNAEYQSFINMRDACGIASVNGEKLNKIFTCYVEFRMPSTTNDDRVYMYLKSPGEYFYYFGFAKGVMEISSNNPKFNEEFRKMKKGDLTKRYNDQTYEIQEAEASRAQMFVNRVQQGRSIATPVKN